MYTYIYIHVWLMVWNIRFFVYREYSLVIKHGNGKFPWMEMLWEKYSINGQFVIAMFHYRRVIIPTDFHVFHKPPTRSHLTFPIFCCCEDVLRLRLLVETIRQIGSPHVYVVLRSPSLGKDSYRMWYTVPACSMVLVYLRTFALNITQSCR